MLDIKITPKPALAPIREGAIVVRPRHGIAVGALLSQLPQDETSTHALTKTQVADEVRVARAIILEMLPKVGLTPEAIHIRVTMNRRFNRRMGDAVTVGYSWAQPLGHIRLSGGALWRRASPTKRRNTVIHELAHILANCEAGRNVGHGAGWKSMMLRLGEQPVRCHSVPRDGLRKQRRRRA